jgi:peptidoglycan/LPS O-acetylase OafA/YrhL/lysophospholipase L1-like esterase
VLGTVALYATFAARAVELDRIRADGLATLAYMANWAQIFSHTSYFQSFAAPSPLKHTWSLAIEEQFYLVWPLVVFAFLRLGRGSRRGLFALVLALAAASATAMAVLYTPGGDPSRVYYGTDTRAQSLLIGAALAIVLSRSSSVRHLPARAVQGIGAAAAIALVWFWSTTNELSGWQYRGGFLFFALLVAMVIASVVTQERGPLARALSVSAVRWVGAISYGLYLWHWPIYVYLSAQRTGLDGSALLALRLAVTFGIATLSYYLVEAPIRHGAVRGWWTRAFVPIVAMSMAVILAVATTGAMPATQKEVTAADLHAPTEPAAQAAHGGTLTAAPPPLPRVMLVGDSMMHSLAPGMARLGTARGLDVWDASVPGCGLSDDGDRRVWNWDGVDPRCIPPWRTRWTPQIDQFKPNIVVAMFGIQDAYDRRVDGREYPFDTPAGHDLAARDLIEAVTTLSHTGARVVLLNSPYYIVGWPQQIHKDRSPYNPAWIDRYNAVVREVASQFPDKVTLLDVNHFLCPQGQWTDNVSGTEVRAIDRVHLSDAGADLVAQWLAPALTSPTRFGAARSAAS